MGVLIGKRIRELREKRCMTQEDIASKLGYSRQRVARIESGDSDISYDSICRIADVLDIKPSEITSVMETEGSINTLFRSVDGNEDFNEKCEELFETMDSIFAHKRLYDRTRRDI